MNMKHTFGAALLGFSLLVSGSVSAATLDFLGSVENKPGGQKDYEADFVRATLTCTGTVDCVGLDSTATSQTNVSNPFNEPTTATANGFIGTTYSDLFYLPNNSAATELAFVNLASGADPVFLSGALTNGGGANTFNFISNALYILFAIGASPDVTIVKNGAYGTAYSFTAVPGAGSGLSHIVEYGAFDQPNGGGGGIDGQIPLPAGLPLMLGAFGVMAFVARRKARKA